MGDSADQPAIAGDSSLGRNRPRPAVKRRVVRRRLLKAAAATGAALVGVSGLYVEPSVRPLQMATVHAFSF
jgi:hypothetical protein